MATGARRPTVTSTVQQPGRVPQPYKRRRKAPRRISPSTRFVRLDAAWEPVSAGEARTLSTGARPQGLAPQGMLLDHDVAHYCSPYQRLSARARRNRLGSTFLGPVDRLEFAAREMRCRMGVGLGWAIADHRAHPAARGLLDDVVEHDRGDEGHREHSGEEQLAVIADHGELELLRRPYPGGVRQLGYHG